MKGLMTSAIRDDNPIIYMFHKGVMGLPWMAKNARSTDEVPEGDYAVPIGKARVAREGSAVTVVTLSLSVHRALDVAERVAGEGVDVEVIDVRSLVPLDREAILTSVAKTGRLVVVDESFGLSGEVVATVADHDPTMLQVPVQRVAVPDVPRPWIGWSDGLDGVDHGLHADHAVLEDERVDAVLDLAAASGRLSLQVQHIVGEHRFQVPGRLGDVTEQLSEDLPGAVLALDHVAAVARIPDERIVAIPDRRRWLPVAT
jgi:hypothetical protein